MTFSKNKVLYLKDMFIQHGRVFKWNPQGPGTACEGWGTESPPGASLSIPVRLSDRLARTCLQNVPLRLVLLLLCSPPEMVSSNTDQPQPCCVAKEDQELPILPLAPENWDSRWTTLPSHLVSFPPLFPGAFQGLPTPGLLPRWPVPDNWVRPSVLFEPLCPKYADSNLPP